MGSNDTAEALAVCHEVNVANEARITELQNELGAAHVARTVFEQQVAELEHENTRLESALADRLRHDAGGTAQAEAERDEALATLARIRAFIDPRRDDPEPITGRAIRRLLDELASAEPLPIAIEPEDVAAAADALRMLATVAAVVRNLPPTYGGLDALAGRLRERLAR